MGSFVLYLLLQLGEPQETPAFFFLCDKNGNKLYFCTLSLFRCLLLVWEGGRVARVWGHRNRETGDEGREFWAGLWLLVSARKDEMQPPQCPHPRA